MNSIQAPPASSALALAVEEFLKKAEAFLQNHYQEGSGSEDVQKILTAINNLHLDVDVERLEQEFDLHCDHTDVMTDYYDSAWF